MAKSTIKTKKIKKETRGIDCSNLINIMQEKGVIVQELADGISVNQSHISRIVTNKRPNISLRTAWDIADYLQTDISKIFIKN
jgi:transcriptional regulator with XRE-family HTH domain